MYDGLIGVVLGSLLSLIWPFLQWRQKRSSLKMAIQFELLQANRLLNERISWIEKPVPDETAENNAEKVVLLDGKPLLLCQSETVRLSLRFWNSHYIELAGFISGNDFMNLASIADLIGQFEAKDADMIKSFQNRNNAQAKQMASACFADLKKIQAELHNHIAKLTNKATQRMR